jgi:hypothetical protein
MTISEEQLFAWLDGELDDVEAARIRAAVEADPKLAELTARHRAFQARLSGAFDPVLRAPVPDHIMAAAVPKRDSRIIDFGAARPSTRPWRGLPQWAAMAATLAAGIVVGTMVPERNAGPVAVRGGTIYAAGALDQSLSTQLASMPVSGKVRVGMTFRDQSGSICRSFTGEASGLACRAGDRWLVRGLFAAPEGQSGDYRMAAGMDPNLAALIESRLAGEPFDANQERAARQRGWR